MKSEEIVFYCSGGKPCIGKLGHKYDKGKWIIIPLKKNKNRVLRKEEYIVPVGYFKKYLDICKKVWYTCSVADERSNYDKVYKRENKRVEIQSWIKQAVKEPNYGYWNNCLCGEKTCRKCEKIT